MGGLRRPTTGRIGTFVPTGFPGCVLWHDYSDTSALTTTFSSISDGYHYSPASWTKTAMTVTANDTTAPDGSVTADKLTTTNATNSLSQNVTNPGASSAAAGSLPTTFTFFAKYSNRQYLVLGTRSSNAASQTYFDIQNGTITTFGSSINSPSITSVGNGWYRCQVTMILNASTVAMIFLPSSTDGSITGASGDEFWLWGCEVTQVRSNSITNKASGVVWSQVTANTQPIYNTTSHPGYNYPTAQGYGAQIISSTDPQVFAALQNSPAYDLFYVGNLTTATDANKAFFAVANSGQPANSTHYFGTCTSGTGKWCSRCINDAGTDSIGVSGEPPGNFINTLPNIFNWSSDSNFINGYINDGYMPTVGSFQNLGALTPNQSAIFAIPRSAVNTFVDGQLGEVILYNRQLTNIERDYVYDYLYNKWFKTPPTPQSPEILPTQVTSVALKAWYRADQGITFNGPFVSQWNDLSGNGYHLTAAVGAQPRYEYNSYNQQPALCFDGYNDIFTNSGLASNFTGNDIPFTVYCIYEITNNIAGSPAPWGFCTTANSTNFHFNFTFTGGEIRFNRLGTQNTGAALAAAINTKYIQRHFFTGTTETTQFNETMVYSNAALNTATLGIDTFNVGGLALSGTPSNFLTGRIAEIFVFTGRPTVTEDTNLANYLYNRYGVANGPKSLDPSQITSVGLKAWYRADQGITIGTGVLQWNDISGNGYHLTQATDGYQPTFEAAGFNSQASVLFDGTNDFMFNIGLAANFTSYRSPLTLFIIFEFVTGFGATPVLWDFGSTTDGTYYHENYFTATTRFDRRDHFHAGKTTSGAAAIVATKYVERYYFSGSTDIAKLNTTQIITGGDLDFPNGVLSDNFTLGAGYNQTISNYANVRVAEVFVFNGQPNALENAGLANYLFNRYGIANG